MTETPHSKSLLGKAIRNRLALLGMSQRELARRSGVSRQTIQNVIHHPRWGFSDETFAAIDHGLKWRPGTAKALHEGKERTDPASIEERINEYLVTILRRLGEMDINQLEREVLMLEEESREYSSSHESRRIIERQIRRLVTSLSANDHQGNHTKDAG